MTPCLWKDSLRGIHKNHSKVRRGSACDHVARVLLVPRSICNDESPPYRREIAAGYIDGDALLAFCAQAIRQQGKINWPRGTVDAALFHRGELVFVDRFRIMQQPPDERRFAVIDASCRCESKKLHRQTLLEELPEGS